MDILLDSHILIWALTDDRRLSRKARQIILDPEHFVFFSAVSVWELSVKHALHPEEVRFGASTLTSFCEEAGFSAREREANDVVYL